MEIPATTWFFVAALADFTGAFVHGVIGHRVLLSPLTQERLFPTRDFGDEDMSWRIFAVTWHIVTASFGCCGVALLLLATGVLEGSSLPVFISALHAMFFALAVIVLRNKLLPTFRRPIPIAFGICMTTVCLASWLGMR